MADATELPRIGAFRSDLAPAEIEAAEVANARALDWPASRNRVVRTWHSPLARAYQPPSGGSYAHSSVYHVPERVSPMSSVYTSCRRGPMAASPCTCRREKPDDAPESNWLPAPVGPYNVALRTYQPQQAIVDGDWFPPGLVRRR